MEKHKAAIAMLRRAVKNGFLCRYLLMDKWFFGKDFIHEVRDIKNGAIHIVTLLKKKNTGFVANGQKRSAQILIEMAVRKQSFRSCRQYKSTYARIRAEYDGIPVQLFII